jgi:hypothetical protein
MGRSSIPGCFARVHIMIVGMVWSAVVFSGAGVAVMGTIEVTTLHHRGPGDPKAPLRPRRCGPR